ncbi:MAG: hypothetical protein RL095_1709 [Verrucomicrobiota bacterium]|jgi:hypothetical protein
MSTTLIKEEAHRIIDQLPAGATWDDLMHEIYVRESIKKSIRDCDEGRMIEVAELRAQYGLKK